MSRTGVRDAIANYLNTAQINYVGAVYPTRNYINEQDYEQRMLNGVTTLIGSSTGSGCVLVVNLEADRRQRRALTGRGAVNDTNIHDVVLELFFANRSGDPQAAQLDYDSIVDGIFEAIRADPTMGTGGIAPGSIWSAGEYDPWIEHAQSEPYTGPDGTTVAITGVVRWAAWEWIAGTGV